MLPINAINAIVLPEWVAEHKKWGESKRSNLIFNILNLASDFFTSVSKPQNEIEIVTQSHFSPAQQAFRQHRKKTDRAVPQLQAAAGQATAAASCLPSRLLEEHLEVDGSHYGFLQLRNLSSWFLETALAIRKARPLKLPQILFFSGNGGGIKAI